MDLSRRLLLGAAAGGAALSLSKAASAAEPAAPPLLGPAPGFARLGLNENPYGPAPSAIKAMTEALSTGAYYPGGGIQRLMEMIAERHGVTTDHIIVSSGSGELLNAIALAYGMKGTLISTNLFWDAYFKFAEDKGVKTVRVPLKPDYSHDFVAMEAAITPTTSLVSVCNPNNPTGSYLKTTEIRKLINSTPKNVLIVLDHAYEEFVDEADYPNAIALVNEFENVVATRTFSKIYGLASLRVGWCYSSEYVAEVLNKVRGPFNVSGPGQVAALAALYDDEFFAASKAHNKKWLKILFQEFAKLDHVKAHPSIANFILLDFGSTEYCQKANHKLLENGFILREMAGYGLPNCLRLTIGTEEENLQVLEVLKAV